MKVYFVTGNKDKWLSARKALTPYGVEMEQVVLETPEIQSESSKEIAEYSAKYAAEKLQTPVLVSDVSWNFKALNGFPGPFAKFVNKWFTVDDYLALMNGKKDLTIIFTEVLSYCKPGKQPVSFEGIIKGKFSRIPKGNRGWGLDKLFIPDGFKQTSAEIDEKTIAEYFATKPKNWKQLAKYLKEEKQ